jgi:hypothetical protein
MPDLNAYYLDWDYDRRNADTGTGSRFGNYLRQSARSFAAIDDDDPAAAFAATAWRTATGPVMSPPLVSCHGRILSTVVQRSQWDGGMIVAVRLATGLPSELFGARPSSGGYYRSHGSTWGRFDGPGEEDLTKGAYLLPEAQVVWRFPDGTLPAIRRVPTGHNEIFRLAVACVEAIVDGLNREVGPLLERLGS